MNSTTTHPLVAAWLRDLTHLLHGVDPGERAEVLAGVREHLEASLPPGASDEDVRRVLTELGSPQSVADEAYDGRPGPTVDAPQSGQMVTWQASTAVAFNAAGVALLAVMTWAGLQPSTDENLPLMPHPSEIVFGGLMFAIPWIGIVLLSVWTPAWSSRNKLLSIWLFPGLAAGFTGVAIAADVVGPVFALQVPRIGLVAAGVWALVRLWRARSATTR